MHAELEALGATREARSALEAEIKALETPHLEAARRLTEDLRADLARIKELEEAANAAARALYTAAVDARRVRLLAGEETPEIAIPSGWRVQSRAKLEITSPDEVPRELCSPDPKAVGLALKQGPVPGAQLVQNPVFVRESCSK